MDIFENAQRSSPVAKEELTSRAKLLEQTLRNFNIAASVHAGQVLDRRSGTVLVPLDISTRITIRRDDFCGGRAGTLGGFCCPLITH